MNEIFMKRFGELDTAHTKIVFKAHGTGSGYAESGQWEGWATSAESLIRASFGEETPHYKNFRVAYENCRGYDDEVHKLIALFRSAKDDFEGGYVFNVELRISGEVFGDFVALARQSLVEGQKDVAAVLACAALEDAIKRLASANSITADGKTMTEIVNSLKSAGLVSGAQKSLLEAMPRIRNMAMHAEWSKITEPDVSSVLGYVEQLLLSKFSGG
ncbi:DUF4145 domain-containing protein [Rhodoferax sp. TS-BS-61-7]|uniref:DUF4145 domain-containing protein n=1 Tax=Rhodoferax sp. TS-BS-61-7 TaxID=2094194 RepID=UPI001F2F8448|nr:DUF4145 domain-containing protein [Rhodoferax sp. TS-BS-61-7]